MTAREQTGPVNRIDSSPPDTQDLRGKREYASCFRSRATPFASFLSGTAFVNGFAGGSARFGPPLVYNQDRDLWD